MRKLYLFMLVSLDGFFEAPGHNLDWHNVDAEFNDFATKQLDATGTLVFGSRTYDMMADFWPKDFAVKMDPETATRMNKMEKIVFSRKMKSADWNNTELHADNLAGEINTLKKKSGKDIAVFGSSDLCVSLLKEKLLDELRIMVNPVILGDGTQLFHGLHQKISLMKTATRNFESGNVLLTYSVNYS